MNLSFHRANPIERAATAELETRFRVDSVRCAPGLRLSLWSQLLFCAHRILCRATIRSLSGPPKNGYNQGAGGSGDPLLRTRGLEESEIQALQRAYGFPATVFGGPFPPKD